MGQLQMNREVHDDIAEYSVYVYRFPDDVLHGHSDWEKKRVTHNKMRAINFARKYFESESYRMVEVKRKAYDDRYERVIDRTFRVFTSETQDIEILRPIQRFFVKFFPKLV